MIPGRSFSGPYMIPGQSYSRPYMIPGRSWQDHSKEICMICIIIWSDYDRPGRETRVIARQPVSFLQGVTDYVTMCVVASGDYAMCCIITALMRKAICAAAIVVTVCELLLTVAFHFPFAWVVDESDVKGFGGMWLFCYIQKQVNGVDVDTNQKCDSITSSNSG